MAEDYKIQLSLSTPPVGSFAKGNMINVRCNTVEELKDIITDIWGEDKVEIMLSQFKAYERIDSSEYD